MKNIACKNKIFVTLTIKNMVSVQTVNILGKFRVEIFCAKENMYRNGNCVGCAILTM